MLINMEEKQNRKDTNSWDI